MNNVVGKMLIVMQLVFSILFMCFAGAVYTFQGQWRKEATDLQAKLDNANQQLKDEQASNADEVKNLMDEKQAAESALATMDAKLKAAQLEADTANTELAEVKLERDKFASDAQVATTEAKARSVEAKALNKEVESLRGRITELRQELQVMEDRLLDSQGKLAEAEEVEGQLLVQVANLKDLLRLNDIDPRTPVPAGAVPQHIEKVDGYVADAQKNAARTQELIKITIGSDDRIYKDMVLTVFRRDKYICQVRVMEVQPDTAVCVVNERTREGLVQVGDNVTTKL